MADTALLGLQELHMQNAELEFEISLKAVSVLRYITDHVERYGLLPMEWGAAQSGRTGRHQKSKHSLSVHWLVLLSVF